jgi:hypothetical protein
VNGVNILVPHRDVSIPTPAIGDIVSFSFESRARMEVPVNPKIYRLRYDISWNASSVPKLHQSGMLDRIIFIFYIYICN